MPQQITALTALLTAEAVLIPACAIRLKAIPMVLTAFLGLASISFWACRRAALAALEAAVGCREMGASAVFSLPWRSLGDKGAFVAGSLLLGFERKGERFLMSVCFPSVEGLLGRAFPGICGEAIGGCAIFAGSKVMCYTERDAVDWCIHPTTRWFKKGSNHSPLQLC